MKNKTIKKNYVVQKRNIVNEMRAHKMTTQELRFFNIYLSLINKEDIKSRAVKIPLSNYQRIMGFERLNMNQIKLSAEKLLGHVIRIPNESDNGFTAFQIFKRCKVYCDESGIWQIEYDAHDDALPLMFEFKDKYLNYKVWNVLRLKSPSHIRMYEILKQYEIIGSRTEKINGLRELLGIESEKYAVWKDFRKYVLDSCQKALQEHTDIKFTYEPIRKGIGRGSGRKITDVKFTIKKNDDYDDQLSLEEFIEQQPDPDVIDGEFKEMAVSTDSFNEPVTEAVGDEQADTRQRNSINDTVKAEFTDKYGRDGQVNRIYDHLKVLHVTGEDEISAILRDVFKKYIDRKSNNEIKSKTAKGRASYFIRMIDTHVNEIKVVDKTNTSKPRNRFANFKARERDFVAIERMEREQQEKEYGNPVPDATSIVDVSDNAPLNDEKSTAPDPAANVLVTEAAVNEQVDTYQTDTPTSVSTKHDMINLTEHEIRKIIDAVKKEENMVIDGIKDGIDEIINESEKKGKKPPVINFTLSYKPILNFLRSFLKQKEKKEEHLVKGNL